MSQHNRPKEILKSKSLREIVGDLKKAQGWLKIAAGAAFLASAFFVVKYFVGGEMTPSQWDGEQWANAVLGLGITAVITSAQAFLYASGYKGPAAVIATAVVVFFGLFSEVSQSMEREDATVKSRSENSAVFQATIGSIENLSAQAASPIRNPYAHDIAAAEKRLARCEARLAQGKEPHCNGDQAHVDSLRSQANEAINQAATSTSTALTRAVGMAKELQYDEQQHYAMIRLLKDLFGVGSIWASFLFSMIIIGTFEYAFHFVGAYVAEHKRALRMIGRDENGQPIEEPAQPRKANNTPAPQPKPQPVEPEQLNTSDLRQRTQKLTAETPPDNVVKLRRHQAPPSSAKQQPPEKLTERGLTVSPSNLTVSPLPSKPPASKPHKPSKVENAIATLWHAISENQLKRSSFPQCKKLIMAKGITGDHQEAQQLAAVALDALEKEGVVRLNPDYDPSKPKGGFDKYKIEKGAPKFRKDIKRTKNES